MDATAAARPLRFTPDAGLGYRARIGLIVPATDQVSEHALRIMVPGEAVAFHTTRLANRNPTNLANLRAMAEGLTAAAALILPDERLDAIAFSCTSAVIALGTDAISARLQAGRPGVPSATPLTAALAAFTRLNIRRIALLTPYIDEVNQPLRRFFESHGHPIASTASFGLESDADMARIPPAAIHDAALECDHPGAEALFISCTALRAVEVIAPLEQRLGKPVVTSHQAMLWQALRHAGYPDPVPGFGQLLT